jgi:SAM-dependent methyltransferase
MTDKQDYIAINKHSWNQRVEPHLHSAFYDVAGCRNGKNVLNSIELDLLGDVSGRTLLHLQCHFGLDSLCLQRMGAQVTGVDFSDKAIETAISLNTSFGLDAQFLCADVCAVPAILDNRFDVVFTSYGTIGWLPDLNPWADTIVRTLKPGGRFVMAEFHPAVWMFDDDFKKIGYSYFNTGAIYEQETGTYADRNANIQSDYVMWNHSLAEIIKALLSRGLTIEAFHEYDYSPYDCFRHTEEYQPGRFRIKHLEHTIPMVFSIACVKK